MSLDPAIAGRGMPAGAPQAKNDASRNAAILAARTATAPFLTVLRWERGWGSAAGSSGHPAAARHVRVGRQQHDPRAVARGQQHALRFHPTDAARLQVRDHDDLAADQRLGRVVLGDPGGQRARGVADLDPELQNLVRAGPPLRLEDLGHPQVDLAEVVDRDLAHSAPSFVDWIRAAGRVSILGKSGAPCRMRAPAGSPPQREASGNRWADSEAGIPSWSHTRCVAAGSTGVNRIVAIRSASSVL